jgi:hypothetical protein
MEISRSRFWLTSSLAALACVSACDAPAYDDDGGEETDPGVGIVSIGPDGDDSSSDDGSDSDSDGESSDTGEEVLYCGEHTLTVVGATPRVMLVLDKSNSMVASTWDHDADPSTPATTRWYSLYETVADLVTDYDADIELGAVMFPSVLLEDNSSANACEVPSTPDVGIALDNGQAILDAMPAGESLDIYGGTPTTAGIVTASEALLALEGDAPRAIVLVTDGAANCSESAGGQQTFTLYDEHLAPLVAELAAEGIPTYVVGIDIVDQWVTVPQANPHDRLSEVAIAGGVPKDGDVPFYNTRDEADLFDALASITGSLQCTVAPEDLPTAAHRVNLMLDEVPLDYVADCSSAGWRYADAGEVELCMSACDDFVAGATLEAAYDCIPEP